MEYRETKGSNIDLFSQSSFASCCIWSITLFSRYWGVSLQWCKSGRVTDEFGELGSLLPSAAGRMVVLSGDVSSYPTSWIELFCQMSKMSLRLVAVVLLLCFGCQCGSETQPHWHGISSIIQLTVKLRSSRDSIGLQKEAVVVQPCKGFQTRGDLKASG